MMIAKLSEAEIDQYFSEHLPYRTRIMLAHYRMTRPAMTEGHAWLEPCFEASVITGRLYLNVLGVFKDDNGKLYRRKNYRNDDVTAEDLGGKFVDLANLPVADETLFVNFITMADKASAHLTTPRKHTWEDTHEAIGRICHYLKSHLYDATGRRSLDLESHLATIET